MAEVTTIARPYAEALFRLADETRALGAWSATLAGMAEVAGHPEVQAVIGNPAITARQLADLFLSLCRGQGREIGAAERNLVALLVENDRLGLLPQIRDQFEILKARREGVLEAEIVSAFPLDDAQKASLVADLERKFGRRVQAGVSVDQSLIGGVRIVVGDEVIDASIQGKLANMAVALRR